MTTEAEVASLITNGQLAVKLGTLVSLVGGRPRAWALTVNDALWLGRMVVAEDGIDPLEEQRDVALVMCSMILRRLAVNMRNASYTSVAHLLIGNPNTHQPYGWSQPLRFHNPVHPEAKTRRWETIPLKYRTAIVDLLTGRQKLVARTVVDAAAPAFTRDRIADPAVGGRYGWRRETVDEDTGRRFPVESWLISTDLSRSSPEPTVYGEGSSMLAKLGIGIAIVLGIRFLVLGGVA